LTTALRALIVEDSADDAELLARELRRHGYDVTYERVHDSDSLDRALTAGRWDIVFSDHSMPQFGSGVALQMVRGRDPDVPFLIVSGTMGEDTAVDAMRAGANDYFVKGRLMRLAAVVDRELRQAAARSARRRMDLTLDALRAVSAVVGRLPEPRSVAGVAVKHARELLAVDAAVLQLWDAEAGLLRTLARDGAGGGPAAQRPGDGAVGAAFERGETVVVEDYQSWPGAIRSDERVQSVMATPLLVGDRRIGVLEVVSFQRRAFTQEDRDLLQLLATDVASPLETARLFAEAQRERAVAEALADAARIVAAGSVTSEGIEAIMGVVAGALAAEDLGLFIPIQNGARFELLAAVGTFKRCAGRSFSADRSIIGRAHRGGVVQSRGRDEDTEELQIVVGAPISLALPIVGSLGTIAVIALAGQDGRVNASLVNVLQRFAALVATALENARLQREADGRQAELEHLAHVDTLTELPNRVVFRDHLRDAIIEAQHRRTAFAVLHVDLVHFKDTNNAYGPALGDALLREIGPRLRPVLGPQAPIARLGGDDFAALVTAGTPEAALSVAREAQAAFERPIPIGDERFSPRVAVGVALFPRDGDDAETLLRRAEVACDLAKKTDGIAVYAVEHDEYAPDRLALMSELRRALERDEFVLHYQPIVTVASRTVTAVEALVRWQHPTRGLLPPADFIPLAERAGLMKRLTLSVTASALRHAKRWRAEGIAFTVAVNISMRTLHDADFPDAVSELLRAIDAKPEWLIFEITESEVMADAAGAMAIVERLRSMDLRLSIDDFGTGYSSLSYLHRLAVHGVKIDRSFVARLSQDENSAAIVRATVELAHALGLDVTAEGVEDAESLALLKTLDCDHAQGFYIGRPMPSGDVSGWVARWSESGKRS
jgi:diguanylate cyclase (GGDEF)-like protein